MRQYWGACAAMCTSGLAKWWQSSEGSPQQSARWHVRAWPSSMCMHACIPSPRLPYMHPSRPTCAMVAQEAVIVPQLHGAAGQIQPHRQEAPAGPVRRGRERRVPRVRGEEVWLESAACAYAQAAGVLREAVSGWAQEQRQAWRKGYASPCSLPPRLGWRSSC